MSNIEFLIIDPNRRPAEVIPHPAWSRRVIEDARRELHASSTESWRRKIVKDTITNHRKRLEQIGVAEHRIVAEIAALESQLFPQPKRRRA